MKAIAVEMVPHNSMIRVTVLRAPMRLSSNVLGTSSRM